MLNASARNCRLSLSPRVKVFDMDMSQFLKDGPRKILRPMSPKVPWAGGVMTVLPEIKQP